MIIVDLDNCIADDAHRIKHIQWQHTDLMLRYHDYHTLAALDNLGNIDIALIDEPRAIFTERPIMFRAMTEEWLRRKRVEYTVLMMRDDDDGRSSEQIKEGMLHALLSNCGVKEGDIWKAYDCRPEIVAMYERNRVPAELRRIHDGDAYQQKTEVVLDTDESKNGLEQ